MLVLARSLASYCIQMKPIDGGCLNSNFPSADCNCNNSNIIMITSNFSTGTANNIPRKIRTPHQPPMMTEMLLYVQYVQYVAGTAGNSSQTRRLDYQSSTGCLPTPREVQSSCFRENVGSRDLASCRYFCPTSCNFTAKKIKGLMTREWMKA